MLRAVLIIMAWASLIVGARAEEPPALERFEFTQLLMGVQARVVLYAPSRDSAETGAKAAFDRIAALEQVMSDYRPDSELSQFNHHAGRDPVPVSPDLWTVLDAAIWVGARTQGAFDPTVGPYVQVWRRARQTGELPRRTDRMFSERDCGLPQLSLDPAHRTASLKSPNALLDLGGIGKGFAVHEAVKSIQQSGIPSCLVALAGDIAVGNAPPHERAWRIAVDTGYDFGRGTIELVNQCCSTSGDAEQFIEIGGVRYSHIIDPATGFGSTSGAAACVVADSGCIADALSTALAVSGVERGRPMLASFPNARAMIVERLGTSSNPGISRKYVSPDFPFLESMVDPQNQPPAGFTLLFNGKDLTNWQGLAASPPELAAMTPQARADAQARADKNMRAHWSVENGTLKFDGKGESLQTIKPYRDFEMYVDWSIDKGGDSGIYLRGTPQVQIWDNPIGSGGLYNNQHELSRPLAVADNPIGEWNRFHIIMKGDRVSVWLNGSHIVDQVRMDNYWEPGKPMYPLGPIELQAHGNPLRFRNIFIREITEPPAPTEQEQRMAWWRDARFGMFIHWGLYAIPAGEWNGKTYGGASEWLMNSAKIKPEDYEPLAAKFNPVKFDASAWADLARDAGMKYIVITTKHHDGFCLFDSAHTTYDVMDATPFKRDVMKELSTAARDKNLQICWYHSIMDWHHPDANKANWPRYAPVLRNQVEEVLTKYGPIGVMWFDGEWIDEWTGDQGKSLYDLCRKLQPSTIINNRVGKGRQGMQGLTGEGDHPGDFGTPEQEVPRRGIPGVDWESCMTMNDSWGFHKTDTNWKSATTLIRTLAETAGKGGNFLLNVGPTDLGEIPQASIDRLRAIGAWMHTNSASIYGTTAGPFEKLPWGRCTAKEGPSGTILYLHVFEWPNTGSLPIPGLLNEVKRAYLLAKPSTPLEVSTDSRGLKITIPKSAPDAANSVLVLELFGQAATIEVPPSPAPDGSLTLTAAEADITGTHAAYESREDRRCIGFWTSDKDTVSWRFRLNQPAKYNVEVTFACQDSDVGSDIQIEVGDQKFPMKVPATGGWGKFETKVLGQFNLPAGTQTLRVAPQKLANDAVMNLRSVRLLPAAAE